MTAFKPITRLHGNGGMSALTRRSSRSCWLAAESTCACRATLCAKCTTADCVAKARSTKRPTTTCSAPSTRCSAASGLQGHPSRHMLHQRAPHFKSAKNSGIAAVACSSHFLLMATGDEDALTAYIGICAMHSHTCGGIFKVMCTDVNICSYYQCDYRTVSLKRQFPSHRCARALQEALTLEAEHHH